MIARTSCLVVAAIVAVAGALSPELVRADEPETDECPAGNRPDFNRDGFADAVVADPSATVAGHAAAGSVVVLYGDADGRVGEGTRRELLSQASENTGGNPEDGDGFGTSLSVADIDCDGFTDVVVGSPFEDLGSATDAGLVQIIWGSAAGLGDSASSRDINRAGFGAVVTAGDQFGSALDTQEDWIDGATGAPNAYVLAIGAPGADVQGRNDAGWVGVRTAVDGGNTLFSITQDTPGVAGAAEGGDRFGAAVAIGQFRGSTGTIDVAVGSPGEDVGLVRDAGSLTVITDIYDEPTGAAYHQDSPGVPGVPERGDRFGRALADIRVADSSYLAVGVPNEDVGTAADAGMVQLFTSAGRPTSRLRAGVGLSQQTRGVAGVAERGDLFGARLALSPSLPGDRVTRLAVGAPGEDAAAVDSGVVQVFPVSNVGAERSWTQGSPGVPGRASAGDNFGSALAVVTGPTENALLVGVPDDTTYPAGMVNVLPFRGTAPRAWIAGTSGIPASGGTFGAVLASAGH